MNGRDAALFIRDTILGRRDWYKPSTRPTLIKKVADLKKAYITRKFLHRNQRYEFLIFMTGNGIHPHQAYEFMVAWFKMSPATQSKFWKEVDGLKKYATPTYRWSKGKRPYTYWDVYHNSYQTFDINSFL